MSGVHRFLSKRDRSQTRKHQHHHHLSKPHPETEHVSKPPDPSSAADFYAFFDYPAQPSSADEPKLKTLRQRLLNTKGVAIRDGAILWTLRSPVSNGDVDAACNFLLAVSDASEGLVRAYDTSTKLKGAENRQGVSCYLDSTLFSMFSRLDSFEAMLYNEFDDLPRKKLSFLLRLWVNLLRSGQLITVDVTRVLQDGIAACGWEEAAELHQQDASEAFTFITSKLELPLLTLKMDIYHTGKEDATDDHKFINERLLEVGIPENPRGEKMEITLEDCLEDYFNNRIEVRRYLERRATLNSAKSPGEKEKGNSVHVEVAEVDQDSSPSTPLISPMKENPLRPIVRNRTTSIIQERYVPTRENSGNPPLYSVESMGSNRSRAGSIRKEVVMPAWQFFSLIPWYTDNAPKNDAQVAAHFSSKRPILGLCLKRYAMRNGHPIRLNTKVDIPVEITLPHFIQDDHLAEDGAVFGNFKLVLQSVVCHRGNSVDSGHYIALVRAGKSTHTTDPLDQPKYWMRFDDLAKERITIVDVSISLEEETPYLLFYQIMPVDGDPGQIMAGERPGESTVPALNVFGSDISLTSRPLSSDGPSSSRQSFEIPIRDEARGRAPAEGRRPSAVSFQDIAVAARKEMADATSPSRTYSPGPRNSSADLSRTHSRTSDGIGRTISSIAGRRSRDDLPDTVVSEVVVREVSEQSMVAERSPQPKANTLAPTNASKLHKREKSNHRLSKHSGKGRESKPDRECMVM